ncbi:helix-turn-helix transcriptional regulator [Yersinia massiliensis]|uniref:helix-turn-helix transcriptional regulator n=1 Tax=Yersinia massiliensis TaxID=419257 RepID=UPI000C15D48D|nr:LuxR C-terminal-related transcriptional regulator [Yersinia massiliensis]PHZ21682.1 helix-turn-helix transcriptional regulator [Yersinia massiliensis]
MTRKQIIIQHPCYFTRQGLENALPPSLMDKSHDIVASVGSLNECFHHLLSFPLAHLVILSFRGKDYLSGDSLSLIVDWLLIHRQDCQVIVIADKFCVHLLTSYFFGVKQVYAVLAHNDPLNKFSFHLKQIFSAPVAAIEKQPCMLSKRERTVLALLLQGRSSNDIAGYLKLSNKTISFHKRSALNKLGISTLQPMLMNSVMASHLLNDIPYH